MKGKKGENERYSTRVLEDANDKRGVKGDNDVPLPILLEVLVGDFVVVLHHVCMCSGVCAKLVARRAQKRGCFSFF